MQPGSSRVSSRAHPAPGIDHFPCPDHRCRKLNPGDKVVFGATVTLSDEETAEETTYQIVGDVEADIKHNRIAVSSPISRALIGQEVGEVVVVRAPAGEREYEIVDVEYM